MSNVIKSNYGYSFRDDNTKVIDTNNLVANRLEELSRIVRVQARESSDFDENFTQGLDAIQVERLLSDGDSDEGAEEESNVIKASSRPQADLSQTRLEAEGILAEARSQAQDILDEANAEAERIRNEARDEGRQVGYNAGYEQGELDAQNSFDEKFAELSAKEKALDDEFEARVSELEPRFVEVLTDVYEHIFHVSLADQKEVIFYLIQDVLRKGESGKSFIIHLSGGDYEFVLSRRQELLSGLSESITAELVEDITLGPNQCFIDTGSGIFDCSVDTQLAALKRELRLLSYTPAEAQDR